MRYLRKLSEMDIALDRAMIPLGSCTMKLNAASELTPVTWPEFNSIHPFAPADQWQGYRIMIEQLEQWLCTVTGYDRISLQPNAGSQGEYAGLLAIKNFHESRGDLHTAMFFLIPSSAHGTNPASAQMANNASRCGESAMSRECRLGRSGRQDPSERRENCSDQDYLSFTHASLKKE